MSRSLRLLFDLANKQTRCVSIFSNTGILEDDIHLFGRNTDPRRDHDATISLERGVIAMAGAGVLLILGLISPADASSTLLRDWNTFLFFLGMMGLSALAEAAGLFDWLAVQAARFAGKSAARLFLNVFLLGSPYLNGSLERCDSAYLNADCLCPGHQASTTCFALSFCLYFHSRFRFFLLPVSNPINIIILSRFPLDLLTFLRLLFLPSLVVIGLNIGIFFLLYRKQLREPLTSSGCHRQSRQSNTKPTSGTPVAFSSWSLSPT